MHWLKIAHFCFVYHLLRSRVEEVSGEAMTIETLDGVVHDIFFGAEVSTNEMRTPCRTVQLAIIS